MVRQEVVCDQYNSMTTSYTEVGDLIGITNIIKIPGTSFWKVLTRKKPTWCMFFLLFTSNDSTSQINLSLVSLKIIVYWMNTNQKQLKCISVYLHVDWFISEIVGKKITFFSGWHCTCHISCLLETQLLLLQSVSTNKMS